MLVAYSQAGMDITRHTVELMPFIDDMAKAYAWADVVVCRAWALTVTEIATKRPETIDELANSLQTVTLLSTKLRRELGSSAQEAVDLEAADGRAVNAIKKLQPRKKGR